MEPSGSRSPPASGAAGRRDVVVILMRNINCKTFKKRVRHIHDRRRLRVLLDAMSREPAFFLCLGRTKMVKYARNIIKVSCIHVVEPSE